MQTLLEICTCRATHLGSYFGPPLGRSKLSDDWQIIPVRYCLNPEYIHQTIQILKSIQNNNFKSLAQDNIHPGYNDTIKYTESLKVHKYLIEISSLKYKDPESSSGWSKYTKDEFFKKLNEIEDLCGEQNVIYISAANVNFTDAHIKDFGTYGEKIFSNNRLKSRQQIDDWLLEHNRPTIYPSDILKNHNASEVFKASKDISHYNSETEEFTRLEIEKRLLNLLQNDNIA